ncbi:MAG: PKD domain-containing protein [Thermoplasmatota archaeon]
MLSKWNKVLLAVMVVLVLSMPIGLVGAGSEDESAVETETADEVFNLEDDGISVTKLDTETMGAILGDIDLEDDLGLVRERQNLVGTQFDTSRLEGTMNMNPLGLEKVDAVKPSIYEKPPTRASDNEADDGDFINGSAFTNWGERVTGDLTWSNIQANIDGIDWYQLDLHNNVDPKANGLVNNVSITMDDYSSSDALYEYAEDWSDPQNPTLVSDYGDYMTMFVVLWDSFTGFSFLGGHEFFYDDGDDNDGWIPSENWTMNFITPVKAEGTNDPDGFGSGFTETGFMYIGITFGYWISNSAPATRDGFTTDYTFTINRATQPNDPGPSDWKNATAPRTGTIRLDSFYNPIDWYKFTGSDTTKLWNFTMSINWTRCNRGATQTMIYDNWVYVYFLTRNDGRDDIWGTSDDGFTGYLFHYTFFGIGSGGVFPNNGQLPARVNIWLKNNFTNAPADMRVAYVGLLQEPQEFSYQGSTITGQYYPSWKAFSDVNFQTTVGEYKDNEAPQITDVKLESNFDQDPTGGYYETEFTLFVTYMDPNNDPPDMINVFVDKDTPYEKKTDISTTPVDLFDTNYADGKRYKLEMVGEDLTDEPYPHTVHVNATDFVAARELRGAKDSLMYNYEEGIRVWDDVPVERNQNWQGIPELQEDDDPTYVPLEGFNGMFKDPENNFRSFRVWNKTTEEWDGDYDTALMHINITEWEGIWQAVITPKHNKHGTESVRFMGYDDHSSVNLTTSITIRPVNDPPKVTEIDVDGIKYQVDNTQPLRPIIHLEDKVDVKEDEEFVFTIIAEDTDDVADQSALEFSYMRAPLSDDWEEDPEVDYSTGEVIFTPTNDDVKAGNSKMVFTIDDNQEDGDIKLEVYFEITNVNDIPTIMIPTTTPRTWKQFQKISIRPLASDDDKGDTYTFSVNFDEAVGDEYDSVLDQLPYTDATKGIDWDINAATGDFWFQLDDQNIWKTPSGMVKSQEITLVFEVTDKAGDSATASIALVLNDENEEPPKPDGITINPTKPKAKEQVNLYVTPVEDPDGDRLTYKWDFGDGSTGEGVNVNHTYTTKGWKTVQMWVEDGQFSTEKISIRIEVLPEDSADDDVVDDDDDVVDPGDPQSEDNTLIYIAIAGIIFVVIILVLLFLFLILRKKPAPAAQQYPGYDQAQLGYYGAQGLPPGYMGELPPQQTPELPPANEGYPPEQLPPAGEQEAPFQPQPEVAPQAPAAEAPGAQPEMQQQEPEQPSGNACPSCGSPVDPSWFLCPNCKSPLQ